METRNERKVSVELISYAAHGDQPDGSCRMRTDSLPLGTNTLKEKPNACIKDGNEKNTAFEKNNVGA